MPWWGVVLIIAGIVAAVVLILYFLGKRVQKKQDEQQAQIDAAKQNVSLLIIDKKKLRLKDAGFPPVVLEQTPKLMRRSKMPIVKAKIVGANIAGGKQIMTFIADKPVWETIPVGKTVKATISGLYITSVKAIRGSLDTKKKKKESKMDQLLKKGRGEA